MVSAKFMYYNTPFAYFSIIFILDESYTKLCQRDKCYEIYRDSGNQLDEALQSYFCNRVFEKANLRQTLVFM